MAEALSGGRRILWALVLGGVAAAAFAPSPLWPLLPVAFALFFALLASTQTAREAAVLASTFGWGYFFTGIAWVAVALARYGGLGWPLALLAVALLALFLALYWGVAGWLTWRFWRLRAGEPIVPALVWIVVEWMRGWLFTGFPWLMPGVAAAQEAGWLNGWFPLIGALGVTGLLVGLAAAWGLAWRRATTWVATVVVLVGGWSLGRIAWSEAAAAPVTVAVIQTSIAQQEKWDARRWQAHLTTLTAEIAATQGTVILTPETVLPLPADQIPALWQQMLQQAAAGRTLVIGLFGRDATGISNRLLSWSPPWHYEKRQLVPFGEYTPPLFRPVAHWLTIPFADQRPGAPLQPALTVAGVPWRANICYESAFARWIVADVAAGAAVLLNASNFAWYGASHGQWQHVQIARARALETARPWVQAVNAGVSAILGPRGETLAIAPAWQAVRLEATVTPQQGLTPFVRGQGEGTIAGLAALLLLILFWRRKTAARQC